MDEEKDMIASATVNSSGDFTETKYILYGLDLEEQQYAFPWVLLLVAIELIAQ